MSSRLDQVINEAKTILAQCIIAANQAAEAAAAIGSAGLAPLLSPAFMGVPTTPTAAVNDASLQIANTSWIAAKLGAASGIATLDVNGLVPITQLPFSGLTFDGTWDANANSPTLVSGSGVAGHFRVVSVAGSTNLNGITTWNVGDWALFSGSAWSRVPYTAPPITNLPLSALAGIANNTFVGNTMGGSASPSAISIASIAGFMPTMIGATGSLSGSVGFVPAPSLGDQGKVLFGDATWKVIPLPDLSAYALLNSPAFTGTATVSTQARNTNSTAIASTAFVLAQLANATEMVPIIDGTASCGTSTYGARIDHIHPTDVSRAPVTNPTFAGTVTVGGTLTGAVVKESNFSLSDVTTGNATTSQHGLLPKLSGNASQFLNGNGGFSSPPASLTGATGGLAVNGSNAIIDTNNALGVGSYSILQMQGTATVAANATITSNGSNLTTAVWDNTGVVASGALIGNGQVWRNVCGVILGSAFPTGLCMRVS